MAGATTTTASASAFLFSTSEEFGAGGSQPDDVVIYQCSCERWFPMEHLYFCTACQKLACRFCVTEEIDSYYCILCLENMLSAEAMVYQNRCRKCFECPVCHCSIPTFSRSAANDVYYLSCNFCQWSSLEVGLQAETPNQFVAENLKREKGGSLQTEFTNLIEGLQKELQERAKDRRQMRYPRRYYRFASRSLQSTSSKSNLTLSLPPKTLTQVEQEVAEKTPAFHHQEPKLQAPPSFDSLLAETPPVLFPKRKPLLTKRCKRCSTCEKILIKPELATDKSDFKQHLVAL